ncbi:MAG TPA: hypothetical protein VF575_02380 [Candidatus Saccharimonadales bacterium]|jgi:hypothetical protein
MDQGEWKKFARAEYVQKMPESELKQLRVKLRMSLETRAKRALAILNEIIDPSISNIGAEAAKSLSILATHHSRASTHKVLSAFEVLYDESPNDTYKESIPAMTDWLAILEHRPQTFGTIWLFDDKQFPFLPTVRDFKNINERRVSYGIEPLRWPKSLVIPEEEQPWLKKPITSAVMREPTSDEISTLIDYL